MRESLIDILAYLFENYTKSHVDSQKEINTELMADGMLQAGFHPQEVSFTVNWLEDLNELQHSNDKIKTPKKSSTRIFSAEECQKISRRAQSYILFLEQKDIIDIVTREIILDRAMNAPDGTVNLSTMKWISMIVLIHRPASQKKLAIISELIFGEDEIKH